MNPEPNGQRYYYDVFGVTMRVERREGRWQLFRVSDEGKSSRVTDIVIPNELKEQELAVFLDDLYHEMASPEHDGVFRQR